MNLPIPSPKPMKRPPVPAQSTAWVVVAADGWTRVERRRQSRRHCWGERDMTPVTTLLMLATNNN